MPLSGGYFYPGVDAAYSTMPVTAVSSSVTLATLPQVSGTIAWLSNVKFAVIYGPLGWTRITTGSAV
jgi:hypothetical protein